jgi:hypothetical protein
VQKKAHKKTGLNQNRFTGKGREQTLKNIHTPFTKGGNETTNTGISNSTALTSETTGNFEFCFDRANITLCLVVVKWNLKVLKKEQVLLFVLPKAFAKVFCFRFV